MTDESRVEQLLDELFDTDGTPESVCSSCPELLPRVRERWRQIQRAQAELDVMFPKAAEQDTGGSAADTTNASVPEIPGYEVESVLGVGGMGVVFRAKHLGLNRIVALKMALAGAYAGPNERARFQREAEAVAALIHPNVVQTHDVGTSDGRPYFTMEYVEGGNLARKLAATPQPARDSATLVATLAGAVQAAHAKGIVHRDLKPSNVLLTADGTPKITDFGLALRGDGEAGLTRTGAVVGTPSYMAPEQARGQAAVVGPPADIYALGAILYECLTGRPPFRAESGAETLLQVLSQDPVSPSKLNGKVPRDLETICLKCLHKSPQLRYATAGALADDLGRFLRGESIVARPEGPIAWVARRLLRRPVVSAVVAVSVALAVAALGYGFWLLAERSATERAADLDLAAMDERLGAQSWAEAQAALGRARDKLGDGGSAARQRRMAQGKHDLELGKWLVTIRAKGAAEGSRAAVVEYAKEFQAAGLGSVGDDPADVAARIRQSIIREALIDALDQWATWAELYVESDEWPWLLAVARNADTDPDPDGWRKRFRDLDVRKDKDQLAALVEAADLDNIRTTPLLIAGQLLHARGGEAIPFLVKVQRRHPDDLPLNVYLGANFFPNDSINGIRYLQAALAIGPKSPFVHFSLGFALIQAKRPQEALDYFKEAERLDPQNVVCRVGLARGYMENNRLPEALDQIRQGLALSPSPRYRQILLQLWLDYYLKQKQWEDARPIWRDALDAFPPKHNDCYGYAEFCLFLGNEDEYLRARQELLTRFEASKDPGIAERTSRACLLRPATEDEMRMILALVDRALAVDRTKYKAVYPHYLFVRGLAEFRQGQYDRAIVTMRGDAGSVLGPAPRLVQAMAQYKSGKAADARKQLDDVVRVYNWTPPAARDQDAWICLSLRREAEELILADPPTKR